MSLTRRQRVFVEAYLRSWNATAAAREAGYSEHSARAIGSENLTKPNIDAAIKERLAELTMSADEVLVRLTEQARADYAAYLRPDGTVDLERLLADGKGRLVKGYKWTNKGDLVVEFHDAQAALLHLGKHLKLFSEEQRNLNADLSALSDEQLERLAAGEDLLVVLGTTREGGAGTAGAAGESQAAMDAAARAAD